MQRWLLALDEPASNPCGNTIINHEPSGCEFIKGMLEREKFCSSAAIATALAVSGENQTNPDSEGTKLSLHLPNERYTCNPDNLYAVPRIDLHEIEWIEADSIEADVSRFVTGSSTATTTTTRNNQRRCCRTSTSSGYSSHSPPLSAGSYSCYASAVPGQSFFRSVPLTIKDQFSGGLPVIHESDAIPRPIWPTVFPSPRELYHSDESPEYDTLYACCGCGCAYSYSYCDWDYEKSAGTSAHDVLLELSRTLNSVIEGKNAMTPEEILHNISYKVAQGIGLKGGLYEYVYHNSSFSPSKRSLLSEKNSCLLSCSKNSSSKVNPVNSKLYNNTRHFYLHNPAWYTCLCTCEHTHKFQSSSKSDEQTETSDELEKKESPPVVLLVDDHYQNTNLESALQNNKSASELNICKCLNRLNSLDGKIQNLYANRCIKSDIKEMINVNEGTKQNRNKVISNDSEYAMLECSDGDSFNKGIVFTSYKNNWDYRMRGFAGDLDFTLDVSRAERLGRVIAKAKRKRQWCKALTAFFGLVFFVLSVVIVSLSVTRGRKVFGSM
ncbi:PREDICTED: uncharacterized protein LOC108580120 [Habropoda laboriosa]|uniref:uncharacterized protein LOC108580120 n=1 Tax=Habropoda laboriosa TaxID=597456 RepID=UPI00083D9F3C|nr:PREDICTED: uncharacterized protein LOC108580120 [Habropoda laboriosa]